MLWDVTQHGVSGSGDQTNALRVILRHPCVQPTADSAPDTAEIYFPAREYLIRGDIMSFNSTQSISADRRWTCFGDGPGASIVKFDSTGTPSTISSPIMALRGNYSATTEGTNNKWFEIRDMTFDGNARAVAAEWLHLEGASQVRLDRVESVDIKGTAIFGSQWWDSCIHDVLFQNCGDAANTKSTVRLQTRITSAQDLSDYWNTACNNLKFEACRHQDHDYYACSYGPLTRLVYHLGCSFVGKASSPPSGLAQIYLGSASYGYSYGICYVGCSFSRTDGTHITADGSNSLLLSANSFDGTGASTYAVRLNNASYAAITGNYFQVQTGSSYAVQLAGTYTGNEIANNAIRVV
jgi:hypothetical protein